jgi:hypothetical protein
MRRMTKPGNEPRPIQVPDAPPHCADHAGVAATGECDGCHRSFCDRCLGFTLDGRVCEACRVRAQARRTRRQVAVIGAGVVAAGGLVAVLVLTHKPQAAPPPPPVESVEPAAVRLAQQRLAEQPCDRRAIVDLAEALLDVDRYAEVIATNGEWVTRCGAYSYLDWKTFHAHKQLGQSKEAVAVVDRILAHDPRDSDYWWWRGEVYDQLKRHEAAVADYRQSIANSKDAPAGRFAAGRLVESAGRAGRPCDLVAALRYFVDDLGGELRPADEDALLAIDAEQRCSARVSGTKGYLPQANAGRPTQVQARVAAEAGRFLVEERTGTTVLTRAFAARAGIASGAETAQTMAAGRLRTGTLARGRIELSGLAVDDLQVLVVDELAPDLDGVIGLDFLWHFQAQPEGKRVALRPRT